MHKITNIALIFTLIGVFSGQEAAYSSDMLRPPSHFNKTTEEFIIKSRSDEPEKFPFEELKNRLSSGNSEIVDTALDELDRIASADDVKRIIEELFRDSGFIIDMEPEDWEIESLSKTVNLTAVYIKKGGKKAGVLRFYPDPDKPSQIIFHSTGFENNLRRRRYFALLQRWVSANSFFSKYAGWKIKLDNPVHSGAAKAWLRSGFGVSITETGGNQNKVIKNAGEIKQGKQYNITGTFLTWEEKQTNTNPLSGLMAQEQKTIDPDKIEDLLLETFYPGYPAETFKRGEAKAGNSAYKYMYVDYIKTKLKKAQEFFYRAGDIFVIDSAYSHLVPKELKKSNARLIYLEFNKDQHKNGEETHNASYLYRHDTILALIGLQRLDLAGKTVVDAGAGNGVIAIASILCGAEKVYVLEKEKSYKNLIEDNAKKNNVLANLDFEYFGKEFRELSANDNHKADVMVLNTSKFGMPGRELADVMSGFKCDKAVVAGGSYADLAGYIDRSLVIISPEDEARIRDFMIREFLDPEDLKISETVSAKIHVLDTNTYASFTLERKPTEDKVSRLSRYMYGDKEHQGKGVIVYKKDTQEQTILPVYEISWMINNFSEEKLAAVISSLKQWKPVHLTIWQEIMNILLLKDMSMEDLDRIKNTNGFLYLSRITSELGESTPYRIYLAIDESGLSGKDIEVEGFVEVWVPPSFSGEKYDSEISAMEINRSKEGREKFTGLGRQLLRYAMRKELDSGAKRIKFGLGGLSRKLLEREGIEVSKTYGPKDIEGFILNGARKTLDILNSSLLRVPSGENAGYRRILNAMNSYSNGGKIDFISRNEIGVPEISLKRAWAHKYETWKSDKVFRIPLVYSDHYILNIMSISFAPLAAFVFSIFYKYAGIPKILYVGSVIWAVAYGMRLIEAHWQETSDAYGIVRNARKYAENPDKAEIDVNLLNYINGFIKLTGWKVVFTDSPYVLAYPQLEQNRVIMSIGWVIASSDTRDKRRYAYLVEELRIIRHSIEGIHQKDERAKSVIMPAESSRRPSRSLLFSRRLLSYI